MSVSRQEPLLFFWTGYFMYIGNAVDTIVHNHHAIQIAISFDDAIEILLSDATVRLKAFIIASDQEHECRTHDSTFLLLNIDPETKIGSGLKRLFLAGQKMAALPEDLAGKFLEEIRPLLSMHNDRDSIHLVTLQFLRTLSQTGETRQLDDRIIQVLKILRQPGDTPVKIRDLAAAVYISPGRLAHLFTDQVGIPIRKYVLWARLMTSLQKIVETKNITASAFDGGFSDAPHFNRTFKRMFGLNPSLLLKNSQIIQVCAS